MNQANKESKEGKERLARFNLIGLVGELGFIIALPVTVLALGGRMLDKKLNSSPLCLLAGLILSLIISGVMVFRRTKSILENIDK